MGRNLLITGIIILVFILFAGCCGAAGPGEGGKSGGALSTGTPEIEISCEKFDIVSPSYEYYKTSNDIPAFSCQVTNEGAETVTVLLSSEIEGHSNKFEQTVVIPPGTTKTVGIHFSYNMPFYDLSSATSATLKTRISVGGETIRVDTENVQIEKSSVFSPELGDEALIAMWVTYNDPCIEEIISEAKKFSPNGEFIGYMGDEENVHAELAAVYYALYFQDVNYVSSTFSTTNAENAIYQQDVRLPYRSLKYKQMNCIDGAVLYAAILEKLDYETGIAFIPGHAFVVVNDGADYWIPIETTVTGDDLSEYWDAVEYGYESLEDPELEIIDVHFAIESGVMPFPTGTHDCGIKNLDEEAEGYRAYMESPAMDCYDADYGHIEDGSCTIDNAAYCREGVVYWDMDGSDCGGVYPNCIDEDYGYIKDGFCTIDNAAYCEDGAVYWAGPGQCE